MEKISSGWFSPQPLANCKPPSRDMAGPHVSSRFGQRWDQSSNLEGNPVADHPRFPTGWSSGIGGLNGTFLSPDLAPDCRSAFASPDTFLFGDLTFSANRPAARFQTGRPARY